MEVFDNNMMMEEEYFSILACKYRQLLQSFIICTVSVVHLMANELNKALKH